VWTLRRRFLSFSLTQAAGQTAPKEADQYDPTTAGFDPRHADLPTERAAPICSCASGRGRELVVRDLRRIKSSGGRGKRAGHHADGKFVVFTVPSGQDELDKARRKKKPEEQPKNGLGIMNLATGEIGHGRARSRTSGRRRFGRLRSVSSRTTVEEARREAGG